MPLSDQTFQCLVTALIVQALINKGLSYDPPGPIVDAAYKITDKIIKKYNP
jgi:hypothetical protein